MNITKHQIATYRRIFAQFNTRKPNEWLDLPKLFGPPMTWADAERMKLELRKIKESSYANT